MMTDIVTWNPPLVPNGIIIGYSLNVSTLSSTVLLIPNISDSAKTVSNLGKLVKDNIQSIFLFLCIDPFVPYYVSVAALTSKGRGQYETKVVFILQGSMSYL